MHPDPCKTLGLELFANAVIEMVRHGLVVELDGDRRAALFDQADVFDEQQFVRGRDGKAADFRIPQVTQEQQLGPGIGR